jgi:hypothetical protein
MSFTEILQEYFRGERQTGCGLAVVGVGLLAGALWVFRTQTGGFAWGLLAPLAFVGLAFGGGGTFLALRSDKQITELAARYERDPATLLAEEVPRMERVNANWPRLKIAWTVVIGVALTLLVVVRRDWASGLGLALLLVATILLFLDVFAERRAILYTHALDQARSAAGPGPPADEKR